MKQARLFPKGPPDGDPDVVVPPPPASREQLRSRRRWPIRAKSYSMLRIAKASVALERRQLELLEEADPIGPIERPRTRGECKDGPRPCPWVSCRHHLYLDVSPRTGALKLNRPDLQPEEMVESCALDVADRGATTLEEVGAIMNLTRERIRQVEVKAFAQLTADEKAAALARDYGFKAGIAGKRRLPLLPSDEPEFDADEFASEALD